MNLKWISSVKISVPMRLATCIQQQVGIGCGSEAMMQADCICKEWLHNTFVKYVIRPAW